MTLIFHLNSVLHMISHNPTWSEVVTNKDKLSILTAAAAVNKELH